MMTYLVCFLITTFAVPALVWAGAAFLSRRKNRWRDHFRR